MIVVKRFKGMDVGNEQWSTWGRVFKGEPDVVFCYAKFSVPEANFFPDACRYNWTVRGSGIMVKYDDSAGSPDVSGTEMMVSTEDDFSRLRGEG
jgi:hypothetical protein